MFASEPGSLQAAEPAHECRFRGTGKHPLWKRPEEVSVVVLPLAVPGAHEARRLEKLFGAMFTLKREVRARVDAYRAGHRRRKQDAGAWRRELGLTRTWLEHRAYQHLERSRWLRHHLTKALALHMADEVWDAADRHLFSDRSGNTAGRPRVGRYYDFTHIPGRARSHTVERKWETFRLTGTLEGHLDAFRHPDLPADIDTRAALAWRQRRSSASTVLALSSRRSTSTTGSGSGAAPAPPSLQEG